MKEISNSVLRNLDDVSCSNVVVSRQIKKLIKKFPSFKTTAIDCWIHDGHYTKFEFTNGKFVWTCDVNKKHPEDVVVTSDSDHLNKDELNKLIVFTFKAMCESKDDLEIIDTPEDLLAYAEIKLKEMLKDSEDTATV